MDYLGIEICCPNCKGELSDETLGNSSYACLSCSRSFPIYFGIPDFRIFPDPYINIEDDRAKGMRVAERFPDLNFVDLVKFYYSITTVVPPHHAKQYSRGLMAGEARAVESLKVWKTVVQCEDGAFGSSLLEVGCGTGPLLVAAAPQVAKLVGIDIAFRWLVVAKKRLNEAGLDVPLFCACAEALPFPDRSFDRVVADSTLEHLRNQKQALMECHRALRTGGFIFVSTPNRFSLGPDPHTGLWAGGMLPRGLVAAYVRRQGGIPPKRNLLSYFSLKKIIHQAGFSTPSVWLPEIPMAQRNQLEKPFRFLVDVYNRAKKMPLLRGMILWISPLFQGVAKKP